MPALWTGIVNELKMTMEGADIDVDDLFGDPGTLDDNSISLPLDRTVVLPSFQAPPVKDLAKHVDESHLSGCRQ